MDEEDEIENEEEEEYFEEEDALNEEDAIADDNNEEENIVEEEDDDYEICEKEEEEEQQEVLYDNYTVELGIELGRIKRNVLIMLKDRGIHISKDEEELINMKSLDIFCKCLNNPKKNYFSCEYTIEKKIILVHFIIHTQKKKVCVDEIKEIFKKKYLNYIIIVPDKLSFDSNVEIQKHKNVQLFSYDFFMFPVIKNVFVPTHILLSKDETEEFLKKRNILIDQLPILRINDPIVKYYGWSINQIIKIIRPGHNFYRVIK